LSDSFTRGAHKLDMATSRDAYYIASQEITLREVYFDKQNLR